MSNEKNRAARKKAERKREQAMNPGQGAPARGQPVALAKKDDKKAKK